MVPSPHNYFHGAVLPVTHFMQSCGYVTSRIDTDYTIEPKYLYSLRQILHVCLDHIESFD